MAHAPLYLDADDVGAIAAKASVFNVMAPLYEAIHTYASEGVTSYRTHLSGKAVNLLKMDGFSVEKVPNSNDYEISWKKQTDAHKTVLEEEIEAFFDKLKAPEKTE